MNAATITALGIAVPAIIGSIVSLVMLFQHNANPQAHNGKTPNPPQSLRLADGGMS